MFAMSVDNLIIERLIRNISHEIKNPLTTIKGYSQLLGMKKGDWDFIEKTRKMVIANVDLIDDKINSLYRIFDISQGKPEKHDLVTLLREMVEGVTEQLHSRVFMKSDADTIHIFADREHLVQTFITLINGFDWNNNNSTELSIHINTRDISGRVPVSLHFSRVDLGIPGNEYFFLPFHDKKLFIAGTELYESYTRAHVNGWEFTLAGNAEQSYYLLKI